VKLPDQRSGLLARVIVMLLDGIPDIFLYDSNIRLKYPLIAGIDEAGRGPLAGPVVASAVILPPDIVIKDLRDSKETTERLRKRLFWEIVCRAIDVGVGIVDVDVIDRVNILNATRMAMEIAINDLQIKPDILLIDTVRLRASGIEQRSIVKGESVSASIASASIVAKVLRDEIMMEYHKEYPDYNFKRHKGYSTREHVRLLQLHGPCPIHRRSFKKVMEMVLPI
jgi:ribonuclease HII